MSDEMNRELVELVPIPPKTVAMVQLEVEEYIAEGLRNHGKQDLLDNQQITVAVEETFPGAEVVHVLFTLGGGIALETFRQVILPWLKKKYETRHKSKKGEEKPAD
jgi:hypothetical protein